MTPLKLAGVDGRAFLEYRLAPGGTVEIVDIVVDDRRKGYGAQLVEWLKRITAHQFGPQTIYAFTRASNEGARAFYKALGFVEAAAVPRFYQDTELPDPAVLVTLEVGR